MCMLRAKGVSILAQAVNALCARSTRMPKNLAQNQPITQSNGEAVEPDTGFRGAADDIAGTWGLVAHGVRHGGDDLVERGAALLVSVAFIKGHQRAVQQLQLRWLRVVDGGAGVQRLGPDRCVDL